MAGMPEMLNFARLRVFAAVVRRGTFAAAADALGFTPSAISQQMATLEAEVGAVLVERTGRGVQLTAAGAVLYERAQRILAEADEAQAQLGALAGLRSAQLRLGSFPTATQQLTARVLKLYRERFLGIDVVLIDDEPHSNLQRLHTRDLDLAVLFRWPGRPIGIDYRGLHVASEDGIDFRLLFTDRYVAVLPDGHRLAAAARLTVADLEDEILVGSPQTPGHDQLTRLSDARGFQPLFTGHQLPDYQAVRELVRTGDGIAVIPALATRLPYPGTVTRPLEGDVPYRDVELARRAGALVPAAASAMIGVLEEVVAATALRDAA